MKTNSSMTLYHKRFNPTTRIDEWDKYEINSVMWQGGKGASLNKGYEKSNDIKIWIPYDKNSNLNVVPISIGDIVVGEAITATITKQSDLLIENFNVTTVIKRDYGSREMQHIFIGAK